MKQIEVFVNSIYQNTKGNKEEIQELKAEMKNHLIETVHELQAEGKTEQEAIKIAIDRFGGEKEIHSLFRHLFQSQKTFAKWVLYLAIVFLLASVFSFGYLKQVAETNKDDGIKLAIAATEIRSILGNKSEITPEMEKKIEEVVKSTNFISSVKIYNVKEINKKHINESLAVDIFNYAKYRLKPNFEFTQKVWSPNWLNPEFYPYGNSDHQWLVAMEERYFMMPSTTILLIGVAISWTLFAIWAIINAYHQKRLNIVWIVGFVLFNVVGYLVYYLFGRKQSYVK